MKRTSLLALGMAVALSGAAGVALAQDKVDSASQKFLTSAMEGDYAEIDVGKLAQEKGTSQAVKDLGAKLVEDHTAHLQKAKQVADQVGVKDPGGASIMEKASYAKLKALSGATFDRTFAKDMVSDHQSDIKEYKKEAAKSDPVGQLAKDTIPTLEDHLKMAQSASQEAQTTGSK
jgi:putative membrane protein